MAHHHLIYWLLLVWPSTADSLMAVRKYHSYRASSLAYSRESPEEALERTKAQFQKLSSKQTADDRSNVAEERDTFMRAYLLQSANSLKEQLKQRKLLSRGKKPDLALRLAESDIQLKHGVAYDGEDQADVLSHEVTMEDGFEVPLEPTPTYLVTEFVDGVSLSPAASAALGRAGFVLPSPIQRASLTALRKRESVILHAETGSGKTLAYLLPITEHLWKSPSDTSFAVILTPTRELAAQVAGIAVVLAPPGSVRMVANPTNLAVRGVKERGGLERGVEHESSTPRIFIGSAKAIQYSLFGDGKMPAPPTPKPLAMAFLKSVRTLVLDEVDRLLAVPRNDNNSKQHEKPAAIVAASVARQSLGRAQIVAASATVGRPLRRELARVLGLPPEECPRVIRGTEADPASSTSTKASTTERAVTIPETVENYILVVEDSTPGKLLTGAYNLIQALSQHQPRKMLLVLTRGFGVSTQNVIGALNHFNCQPSPRSLLDALEAEGTDRMIEKHRQVSGASGVGEKSLTSKKSVNADEGYLLVTGEDSIRGLHLDGLDVVIIVGRPNGPNEYTHIAGRTGRAGKKGMAINVVSLENAAALRSWERMLDCEFSSTSLGQVAAMP